MSRDSNPSTSTIIVNIRLWSCFCSIEKQIQNCMQCIRRFSKHIAHHPAAFTKDVFVNVTDLVSLYIISWKFFRAVHFSKTSSGRKKKHSFSLLIGHELLISCSICLIILFYFLFSTDISLKSAY